MTRARIAPTTSFPRTDAAEEPTVLRCSGTADFLAALPFLTGFTARDSLFLVLFEGRRAGRAIRLDLPESDGPCDTAALLDAICALMHRSGAGAHGPALVITCERTFAEADGAPWRRLATRIERRFAREGWWLRELACVAPDGWVAYRDPRAPRLGRPLSEIKSSPVHAAGSALGDSPDTLAALCELPTPDPAIVRAVAAQLQRIATAPPEVDVVSDSDAPTARDERLPEWVQRTIANAAQTLTVRNRTREARADPAALAQLIADAAAPTTWLLQALTLLSRPEFVLDLVAEVGVSALPTLARHPMRTPAPAAHPRWSMQQFLLEIAAEAPEQTKLRHAVAVLEVAAAHAPRLRRPGVLALLAWTWWELGMQSVAEHHLQTALELDPEHELARLVQGLNRAVPLWLLPGGTAK